jgi:GT2 family glycosyltransferase
MEIENFSKILCYRISFFWKKNLEATMRKSFNFAAFIMTYKRVVTLESTINALLNQTYPPQKILIIDNDPDKSAETLKSKFLHLPVEYFAVGYNSGPAGAAKKGLETLSKEGFDWIAWMDDDDPPIFLDIFEKLLNAAVVEKKCGSIGVVGQHYDKKKGLINRVQDVEIEGEGVLEVDNVGGGMCKIVNANVCRLNNIYPDEKLFFGFEELDFDLRVQKVGYMILAHKELYNRHRVKYNRVGLHVKKGLKKDWSKIWREYYSVRNTLYILHKHYYFRAILYTITRSIGKIFVGFRFGFHYGKKNTYFIFLALFHFMIGKKGKIHF